jgi:hypothetical protein
VEPGGWRVMNRRTLLAGASLLASSRVLAQPMPVIGPVGGQPPGAGGPLWSVNTSPPGKTLDLSFMAPGTLDPRVTFTRASTATYFNNTAVMQTAAINAPRWDYNPSTLALNGLLIEEARTNGVLNSGDLTVSANWAASAVIVTAGTDAAPTGSQMMSKLAENGAASPHFVPQTGIPVTSGTLYTLSCYARGATRRYLQLSLDDPSNGGFATFDLQAGTVSQALAARGTGATIGTASITSIGGGTYRCAITVAVPGTTGRVVIIMANGPTPGFAPSYAGNVGFTLSIWGVQLEQGASPTSYIPTTAAAVTRAIDQCSIQPANMGWFVSPGGSWFVEFISLYGYPDYQRIISAIPGPGNIAPLMLANGGQASQYDGAILPPVTNSISAGVVSKAASTWAAAFGRVCCNNGPISSGAMSVGYSINATGLFFFQAPSNSTQNLTGYLRRVSYWPRVLTDAEMQSVTT